MKRERGRKPKKKICSFCVDKVETIDYKELGKIRRYTTERGKILPRRISGNCAKHQRWNRQKEMHGFTFEIINNKDL